MLWRDARDPERVVNLADGAYWFLLPSLPLFILFAVAASLGHRILVSLTFGVAMTAVLYAGFFWLAPRFGLKI